MSRNISKKIIRSQFDLKVELTRTMLGVNNAFLMFALDEICRQTLKASHPDYDLDVLALDGVGLNKADWKILKSMNEWYKEKGFVSDKQLMVIRNKMLKYSEQIANGVLRTHWRELARDHYAEKVAEKEQEPEIFEIMDPTSGASISE